MYSKRSYDETETINLDKETDGAEKWPQKRFKAHQEIKRYFQNKTFYRKFYSFDSNDMKFP